LGWLARVPYPYLSPYGAVLADDVGSPYGCGCGYG
jgi:hypothetical protein